MGGRGRNNSKVVLPVQDSGSSALTFGKGSLPLSAVTQNSSILLNDFSSRSVSVVLITSLYFMGIGQFSSVGWNNFVRG